jgi:hypothetical protein
LADTGRALRRLAGIYHGIQFNRLRCVLHRVSLKLSGEMGYCEANVACCSHIRKKYA